MTTERARARVATRASGRKDILPGPIRRRRRILACQCLRKVDASVAELYRVVMPRSHRAKVRLQCCRDGVGKNRHAVLLPFAVADCDLRVLEVDILDA